MTDFDKLLSFSKLIGVQVVQKLEEDFEDEGDFDMANGVITICKGNKKSKRIVLALLHELGHAMDWIDRGRPSEGDYIDKVSSGDRNAVWTSEYIATGYMRQIHRMLKLNLSKKNLETAITFDRWVADQYYKTGRYPSLRQRESMYRNIRRAYESSES